MMARLAPGATADQVRAALEPAFQAAARDGWVAQRTPVADRPDDPRLLVESGAQGRTTPAARSGAAAAAAGARRARARRGLHQRVDAAGRARRRPSPRLRAAAWRSAPAAAASSGSASSRRCCSPARRAAAGTALAWIGRGALRSLQPLGRPGHASCSICRIDARVLGGDGRRCRWSARWPSGSCPRCRRAASTWHGVPGRRAHAGGGGRSLAVARAARRAGGAVAGAADQRRPVRPDAGQPGGLDAGFNQRGLAAVPHRRHVGRLCRGPASSPLHDRIEARLAALPGVRGRDLLARGAAVARAREQVDLADRHGAGRASRRIVNTNGVAPNFFATMALPVMRRAAPSPTRIARGRRRWRWSARRSRAAVRRRRQPDWPATCSWAPRPSPTRWRWSAWPRDAKYTDLRDGDGADDLHAGAAADRRQRQLRRPRRRRSGRGAGGDPQARCARSIRACRSSTCAPSASRSNDCTGRSACSPGSRRSSA